jgi:hypothetical protein
VFGPYAYDLPKYYPHHNIKWVPYSTSIEEDVGALDFNEHPIEQVLLSGSVAWDRPFREYVFGLDDDRLAKLGHPGYAARFKNDGEHKIGAWWFREIHRYLCAFCDGHSLRYIHLRNFEVASTGALLLADRIVEQEMNLLGFIDGETCIFCDQGDFLDKVSWVLDPANRPQVDRIRRAGMRLCLERHTTKQRVSEFVEMLMASLPP